MLTKTPEARPGSLENMLDASIIWRYVAPVGHSLEDCMAKDYWRNALREVSQQRVVGRPARNRIEIFAEDNTWEAELRVMSVDGNGQVTTRLLRHWQEPPVKGKKPSPPEGTKVEHISGNGWRALDRKGDVIEDKLATEDDAVRAAVAHSKK